MLLRKIELLGFKTFADKTELEFTHGITAVVGPNGSGKSNVTDAIQWVMGEQNVRNLRATRNQDVIFAGSEKRKPLGMAEVTLTLDNSSGKLPIGYNEVTITRRAFRSGESEYYINKTPCRLKDIYELFLDTGVGREAYSTVSQGEIDAVLSAKSEDRRALLEEAAGIKKYRHRRKEATNKLEHAEANLRRVNDIIAELADQVEPLREQAEVAIRYNELVTRLREIEIGLLINDLRRQTAELEKIRDLKAGGAGQLAELDRRISDLEWEKEDLSEKLAALERELDGARITHQEVSSEVQRLESRLALLDERMRSAGDSQEKLKAEVIELEARRVATVEGRQKLVDEEVACSEREAEIEKQLEAKKEEARWLDETISAATREVDDQKASYIELAKELASKRNEAENARVRVVELEAGVAKLSGQLERIREESRECRKQHEAALGRIEELKAQFDDVQGKIASGKNELAAKQAKLADLARETDACAKAMVERSARLKTLREMEEAHEGFFEGVKNVLTARKAGKLPGNYNVVADVIEVPVGFETAFEVALGSSLQDIITDSVDDAKRAIAFLKDNRAGRATFLPLDGIRPSHANVSGDFKKLPGVFGLGSDILTYEHKYSAAINVLVGRTIIVDNIDNAVNLSRRSSGWNKIVTLEGEVIVPSGAMTGGVKSSRGPNLLVRKQEISMLSDQLKSLDAQFKKLQDSGESLKSELGEREESIRTWERELSDTRVALADAERHAKSIQQELSRLEGDLEITEAEKDEAHELLVKEREHVARVTAELQAAGQENTSLDEQVTDAEKTIEKLQTSRQTLADEVMQLNVQYASIKERRTGLQQTIQSSDRTAAELAEQIRTKKEQIEQQVVDCGAYGRDRENIASELETKKVQEETAAKQLEELTAKRSDKAQHLAQVDSDLKGVNRTRSELADTIHDADVREARLEVQISQCGTRLLEEYEITVEQALAMEENVEVERGTATEVARLRREIKLMGAVNTGAIQEYERVSERWEFLSTQKSDLEQARAGLIEAIREIDDSTRGLFMETFNKVASNFDYMFKRLFGGGMTELVLTDPDNLLETGVEVIVQPPGKKLQNLQLLSGGERALTACALIFSLMMVRPSPFVLMDEVDAPLDESNVERFAEMIQEFSRNSQFIVITHNKATMEAADILYGVTMQEPGVSRLISVKLGREDSGGESDFVETGVVVAAEPA